MEENNITIQQEQGHLPLKIVFVLILTALGIIIFIVSKIEIVNVPAYSDSSVYMLLLLRRWVYFCFVAL